MIEESRREFSPKQSRTTAFPEASKERPTAMTYLYHGSNCVVNSPDLTHSRTDIDFWVGFYLTRDENMANKLASGKDKAIVNSYLMKENYPGLKVVWLKPNAEWMDFVSSNRGKSDEIFDVSGIDIIIGPTADDRMFKTLDRYYEGSITRDEALKCLNALNFTYQVVLKTEKAIEQLVYVNSRELPQKEVERWKKAVLSDSEKANRIVSEILRNSRNREKQSIRRLGEDYEER